MLISYPPKEKTMTKALFILIVLIASLAACKKKEELPGSPYTKEIAGKRTLSCHYLTVVNSTVTNDHTDTIVFDLTYINNATLRLGSPDYIFDKDHSSDTELHFIHSDDLYSGGSLTYIPGTKAISYGHSTHMSAAGTSSTECYSID